MTWLSDKHRIQVGCYVEPGTTDAVSAPVEAYRVALPHSCDTWDVAYGRTREEALIEVDEFIAELQAARTELARRPLGDRDDEEPRSFP